MSRIRGRHTRPEMIVRRYLHGRGLRYRLHAKKLPGSPDVVFRSRRIAIFVHGCFWHRHSCCEHKLPKTRTDYWRAKFERNRARDEMSYAALRKLGWHVHVVWECETADRHSLEEIARIVEEAPVKV